MEKFGHVLPPHLAKDLSCESIQDGAVVLNRLRKLQSRLQTVWKEPDQRTKIYGVFWILGGLENLDGRKLIEIESESLVVPIQRPFERALFQLLKDSDFAKFCPNPDCPAPYFFAQRRSQKFCSSVCSAPTQREAKLRWWNEKGCEKRAMMLKLKSSGNSVNRKKKSRKGKSYALQTAL